MSSQVTIETQIGTNKFGFEWDNQYQLVSSDYKYQATEALKQLEEGYNRVRAAILSGMPPENKIANSVVDDRPIVESRVVGSGPVNVKPVNRC